MKPSDEDEFDEHERQHDQEMEEIGEHEENQEEHADDFKISLDELHEIDFREDDKSRITHSVEKFFKNVDINYEELAGLYYMLVGGILLAIVTFVYLLRMTKIPPLQFIFILLIFAFMINYCIMRDSSISITINEENNSRSKITCFLGFFALIFTLQALDHIPIETALTIFYMSTIFGVLIDITRGRKKYSGTQCIWCIATLVGVLFILRPPFVFGDWGESHMLGHWVVVQEESPNSGNITAEFTLSYVATEGLVSEDSQENPVDQPVKEEETIKEKELDQIIQEEQREGVIEEPPLVEENTTQVTEPKNEEEKPPLEQPEEVIEPEKEEEIKEPIQEVPIIIKEQNRKIQYQEGKFIKANSFKGMALATAGSILLSITVNCFRKLNEPHQMKLTNIFTIIMIIFIPVFFPIEGVTSPGLVDWLILCLLGCLTYFALLCMIKGCQEEDSGKILSVSTLPLLGVVLSQFFISQSFSQYFWGLVGCAFIVVGVVMLMNETDGDIVSQFKGIQNKINDFKQKKFPQDQNVNSDQ